MANGKAFYVLGPLVTDIAPGYDHIIGAIGGAVAAYAGDLARGRGFEMDDAMARARKRLDWPTMFEVCIDPKARRYRDRGCTEMEYRCSMCGDICAVKIVNR